MDGPQVQKMASSMVRTRAHLLVLALGWAWAIEKALLVEPMKAVAWAMRLMQRQVVRKVHLKVGKTAPVRAPSSEGPLESLKEAE